jgi:hypothetical protein
VARQRSGPRDNATTRDFRRRVIHSRLKGAGNGKRVNTKTKPCSQDRGGLLISRHLRDMCHSISRHPKPNHATPRGHRGARDDVLLLAGPELPLDLRRTDCIR